MEMESDIETSSAILHNWRFKLQNFQSKNNSEAMLDDMASVKPCRRNTSGIHSRKCKLLKLHNFKN
jgi:hypothetical protein